MQTAENHSPHLQPRRSLYEYESAALLSNHVGQFLQNGYLVGCQSGRKAGWHGAEKQWCSSAALQQSEKKALRSTGASAK